MFEIECLLATLYKFYYLSMNRSKEYLELSIIIKDNRLRYKADQLLKRVDVNVDGICSGC